LGYFIAYYIITSTAFCCIHFSALPCFLVPYLFLHCFVCFSGFVTDLAKKYNQSKHKITTVGSDDN